MHVKGGLSIKMLGHHLARKEGKRNVWRRRREPVTQKNQTKVWLLGKLVPAR